MFWRECAGAHSENSAKGKVMKTHLSIAWKPLAVTGSFLVLACSADFHDNVVNIPNATVNATANVDADNVMPEQTVPVALTVTNVYLVEPTATPPAEHVLDAGHVRIYLDDVTTPPLVVTAQVNVDVKIPPQTKAGKHKLICRVHKHDGTATSTKVEVEINVKVTIGTGTGGTTGSGGAVGTGGSTATGGAGGTTAAGGAGGAGAA